MYIRIETKNKFSDTSKMIYVSMEIPFNKNLSLSISASSNNIFTSSLSHTFSIVQHSDHASYTLLHIHHNTTHNNIFSMYTYECIYALIYYSLFFLNPFPFRSLILLSQSVYHLTEFERQRTHVHVLPLQLYVYIIWCW